jgi:hypothetical protein
MNNDLKDFYKYFDISISVSKNEITTTGDFIMWFVEEETSEEEPTRQSDIQNTVEQKAAY